MLCLASGDGSSRSLTTDCVSQDFRVGLFTLFAARRADAAAVIARAVELGTVHGMGHRRIADRMGDPE